jgi:hypothetical protein
MFSYNNFGTDFDDELWNNSSLDTESKDEEVPIQSSFPPPEVVKTFVTVDDDKPMFQCTSNTLTIPMTSDCAIRWKISSLLSQGTQAYIFATCTDCPVVRIAELDILDPTNLEGETYEQFHVDSQIRYMLKCNEMVHPIAPDREYCLDLKISPDLYDVFICENNQRYFGITALERYDGDLLDLLLRLPRLVVWNELAFKLSQVVRCLHARGIIHRDVGWQNFLYRLNDDEKTVDIVLTDFESSGSEMTVKGDNWGRLYDAYSHSDITSVGDTIEYLKDAKTFVDLFKKYENLDDPPGTSDEALKDAWQAMESLEWDKLSKFFHLNAAWTNYLEN